MTAKCNARRRQFQPTRDAIDVAVEGLHHAENELAHAFTPPHRCPTGFLVVLRPRRRQMDTPVLRPEQMLGRRLTLNSTYQKPPYLTPVRLPDQHVQPGAFRFRWEVYEDVDRGAV